MKDIIITAKRIRKEINIYLISFVLSFIINIIAIVIYARPWIEVFTQIGYVVIISLFIYFILWLPRILISGLRILFQKRK